MAGTGVGGPASPHRRPKASGHEPADVERSQAVPRSDRRADSARRLRPADGRRVGRHRAAPLFGLRMNTNSKAVRRQDVRRHGLADPHAVADRRFLVTEDGGRGSSCPRAPKNQTSMPRIAWPATPGSGSPGPGPGTLVDRYMAGSTSRYSANRSGPGSTSPGPGVRQALTGERSFDVVDRDPVVLDQRRLPGRQHDEVIGPAAVDLLADHVDEHAPRHHGPLALHAALRRPPRTGDVGTDQPVVEASPDPDMVQPVDLGAHVVGELDSLLEGGQEERGRSARALDDPVVAGGRRTR